MSHACRWSAVAAAPPAVRARCKHSDTRVAEGGGEVHSTRKPVAMDASSASAESSRQAKSPRVSGTGAGPVEKRVTTPVDSTPLAGFTSRRKSSFLTPAGPFDRTCKCPSS